MHRPHNGELVRVLGQHREVFAEMNAGRGGLDVLEFTADFRGRFRLGVERFVMAHATPRVDDDARLGFALRCGRAGGGLEIRGQRQPSQSHACAQEISSTMVQAQHRVGRPNVVPIY